MTKEITIEKDTIHVEMKNVYGNNLIYPVCHRAKLFTSITGKETLTRDAIYFIRKLGYKVKNKEVLIPWIYFF